MYLSLVVWIFEVCFLEIIVISDILKWAFDICLKFDHMRYTRLASEDAP